MEIYRVTLENSFSDEVMQSHYFATEQSAIKFAESFIEEIAADDDVMADIIVAAYTPDSEGEFFFDHEIKTYEL